ncbi:MAG: TetR/AcrR family transcriptional regulator [Candidatus Cloacimonetes bacterium]|nr:TetR/AcrR family transcriptional regulator [Candidatus Cloacimonadota bacterium]
MDTDRKQLRKAGRQNKRDLLLNAAIEVFAHKGSNSATIADVAKRARVALGTVYVYFESKDDLLQHCMREIVDSELNSIIKQTETIFDPMDRLYAFFQQHVALVKEKPHVARFITVEARQSESFTNRNPGYNPLQKYLEFVKETTASAISKGNIMPIDPQALALILVGTMDIVLCQWLAGDKNVDIETIGQSIRNIIHTGVAVNP